MPPKSSKLPKIHPNKDFRELEARRKAVGVSKRALADRAGLDLDYYSHWSSQHFLEPGSLKLADLQEAMGELEAEKKDASAKREMRAQRRAQHVTPAAVDGDPS